MRIEENPLIHALRLGIYADRHHDAETERDLAPRQSGA
jgi:hypothetical protein